MDKRMDISTLENWLWDAACNIRGPIDAPKFKDYILPLLFYKSWRYHKESTVC